MFEKVLKGTVVKLPSNSFKSTDGYTYPSLCTKVGSKGNTSPNRGKILRDRILIVNESED
ncbi:hypothetical protein [Ruminiclostridium cellulolyticum]|uniref:hypothetical protein n=1 Tax=Ruminiclostridium cellulolyticum TaxID=1521 RepID=UPI00059FE575|nr:hypothetical protein [Ruminiclostridium cellulolyticum]